MRLIQARYNPLSSQFGDANQVIGNLPVDDRPNSFGRLWRTFMTARITIAAVLLVLQVFVYTLGNVNNGWSIAVCAAYLLATVAVRLLARPKPPGSMFDAQWALTVGVDVAVFTLLNFLQSSGINYTPLFALPVLLASILGPILLALGTAASVTLLLLMDAWWMSLSFPSDSAARFLQSGLSGFGFFSVALLANQLALRLAREQRLSRASQQVARIQTQVNELVIESLADGVLVVDANGIVRSANPAALRLLVTGETTRTTPRAAPRTTPFVLATQAAWRPLAEIIQTTFANQSPQQADVSLQDAEQTMRRLHVRTRLAATQGHADEALCVAFLEDLREMEARVRVEKMAAMGRMSAAVAHEIRNPLAAISQANALLEEDLQSPAHKQLTAMVRQNAQRLAKIVDDILNISRVQVPSAEAHGTVLMLDDAIARITSDWTKQTLSQDRTRVALAATSACLAFDPEHLRRLMVNLLDNALRYASQSSDAIKITTLMPSDGQARLSVWSDGLPLEKTVETHLFEPFFTSESRSSGLGLYICRELCERYGAIIGYQRAAKDSKDGNEFFVLFKLATKAQSAAGPAPDDLFA